jgi:transposase InsO family protein
MGITVCERTAWLLMSQAGIYGLPGPARVKRLRGVVTADDLVNRKFHSLRPNELWVTDITQHRKREGWVYRGRGSRRLQPSHRGLVDRFQAALHPRGERPRHGDPQPPARAWGIVHADHGTQFTSWVFGEKIRSVGLLPSFGTVGDGLDNAMMESFWSSMQIELLNRRRCKTRVELANATFEYIEIFHNRRRRHSALGYRTPIEYELLSENDTITAVS